MSKNFWKTIKTKTIYSSPWCTVKEEIVKLPSGQIIENYSIIELPDVAMVFPITKDNQVIMVKQYRHGIQKTLLELPAGIYDKMKEKPEAAAKRELWEETGYKTDNLVFLGKVYEYPMKDRHSVSFYFTDDITFQPTAFKEIAEEVEVIKVPFDELEKYIQKGEIQVSGTITAVHLAEKYLENKMNNKRV